MFYVLKCLRAIAQDRTERIEMTITTDLTKKFASRQISRILTLLDDAQVEELIVKIIRRELWFFHDEILSICKNSGGINNE